MEARLRVLLLAAALSPAAPALAQDGGGGVPGPGSPEPVIEPELDRREIKEARIDTEDFEIGLYAGVMTIEDFGSDTVVGVRGAYHVTEDFFVELTYGMTEAGTTSFERLSGGASLLTDDEREYRYYTVDLGWNVFPGEAFLGKGRAVNTALYLVAGAGSTDFAGDERFTVNLGGGYRILTLDWLAIHITVRDHILDLDVTGEDKTTHNVELTAGLSFFF